MGSSVDAMSGYFVSATHLTVSIPSFAYLTIFQELALLAKLAKWSSIKQKHI